MFNDLITAAKALLNAVDILRQLDKVRARKLSEIFGRLSALLAEIVQRKSAKENFIDLCGELKTYAASIRSLGKGVQSQEKLEAISSTLEKAMEARELLYAAHNPDSDAYSEQVNSLLEASGVFRALALIVKPAG